MLAFEMIHPQAHKAMLGLIPAFVSERDPASARDQLHKHYSHGGGWRPFKGFELLPDNSIAYPGDPPLPPLAKATLREETIVVYPHAWVAIIQPDRSFEIARMD